MTTYVQNCWYVAAYDTDILESTFFELTIINEPVVIYRTTQGELVALENRCCHRFAPLSKGRIEDGCNVRCMYHGLKFDPAGRCIEIPGQDRIPTTAKVKSFPVVTRHSWVWVWMGDAEMADETLIPAAVGYDDPKYVLCHGQIDYDAYYELINDNLTDFSHLSYVHANSFGATEHWANTRPKVDVLERGIRVTRWVGPEQQGLKNSTDILGNELEEGATAMFSTYNFLAPGILLMCTGTYRAEDMPADQISPPTAEPLGESFTSQAVTPLTDTTSRYFFMWGPRAKDGDQQVAEQMMVVAKQAFAEDKEMIEAQQKNIRLKPGREILTSADVGPVRMRQILKQLAAGYTTPDASVASVG